MTHQVRGTSEAKISITQGVYRPGQLRNGGLVEYQTQWSIHNECFSNIENEPRGKNGMTAKIEEVFIKWN
jgi:hypothetical protein